MIPPCKGCVLVPLCRHKPYSKLFDNCILIEEYIIEPYNRFKRNNLRVEMVYIVLRPTYWHYIEAGYVQ